MFEDRDVNQVKFEEKITDVKIKFTQISTTTSKRYITEVLKDLFAICCDVSV